MDSGRCMDSDLTNGLKTGDSNSFEQLVTVYQERVLNVCFSFTRNREDAEDLAQEVFIEVYQSIKNFRGDAKLGTWINRIAINRSLDLIRLRKRKKRYAPVLRIFSHDETPVDPPAPMASMPDHSIEQEERSRILHQAVNTLAENQRIAITLSKYQEYDNAEIAEIMGITISAVVSLLHRAKKNLHHRLYKYYKINL
jgi:RNA polymerase sigma-70 factor (ECF subfamily)